MSARKTLLLHPRGGEKLHDKSALMKLYTKRSVFSPHPPPNCCNCLFGGEGLEVLHSGIVKVLKKEKEKRAAFFFCCSTVYCTTDLRALVNAHTYADTRDVTDRAAASECAQRRKKKKKSSLRTHRPLSFCLFLFFFYACLFLFLIVCFFLWTY